MDTKTIVLINHQPIMLEGLLRIFGTSEYFTLIEGGINCSHALELSIKHTPDIILIDAEDGEKTVSATCQIAQRRQNTKVVVFSSTFNVDIAMRALDAGAKGYIASTSTSDELLSATRLIADGETFISANIASKIIDALRIAAHRKAIKAQNRLNVREEQIVQLLQQGKTNKEIASALDLREKTIKHYMTILMQKLDARNRLELAMTCHASDNRVTENRLFN